MDLSCGTGGSCIGGEFELPVNTEPTIELARSASQNAYGVVQIPLGTAYEACAPGQVRAAFFFAVPTGGHACIELLFVLYMIVLWGFSLY